MRAIVTGGCGFIGSHLVDRLLRTGWSVLVIDDLRSSPVDVSTLLEDWPHARRDQLDIRFVSINQASQEHDLGPADVIFHLASPVGPVGVLGRAGLIALEIIIDSGIVAAWAADRVCPLIDVSTSEVYGGGVAGQCSEDMPSVLVADASPRLEYAASKRAAEIMLLDRHELDVRVVRPFNVAGPRQSSRGGFVLPRFVSQALRDKPLTVYQPGDQRRAFTHVADIVDGLLAVLERGDRHRVYNLGNEANLTSIIGLAAEVIDATSSSSSVEIVDPARLWGPDFREAADKYPDSTWACEALGWEPKRSRRDTIDDVARYMQRPGMLRRLGA